MKIEPATILWDLISRLSNTVLTVRISGGAGSVNEKIARLLHCHYPHKNPIFFKFNCKTLKMQSEARTKQVPGNGLVETFLSVLAAPQYHVLYLQHVECLPEALQGMLLRLFDNNHLPGPPWIITSSVEPLEYCAERSGFSYPLLKKLDTVHITLPPLYTIQAELSCPKQSWIACRNEGRTDELATINALSLARLDIQKERILEGLMTNSNPQEIGLLDLAIFDEAVSQIADHILYRDLEWNQYK